MRFILFALLAVVVVSSVHAVDDLIDQVFIEPQPLLEPNIILPPIETRTLGAYTVVLTTEPERLAPREGVLIITMREGDTPAAGEPVTLRLEGRKRVLAETVVVTNEQGEIRLATYFSAPGTYTLVLTHTDATTSFPLLVRGTRLLVIGLLVASGVLLALLFEKRLP